MLESALSLVLIRLALSFLPFGSVLSLHTILSTRLRSRLLRPPSHRIAWAVDLASRYVPVTGNCLIQALAVHTMLTRWRHPAQLRIGVAKDADGTLRAHAWVESDGEVVIGGPGVDAFTPLAASRRQTA